MSAEQETVLLIKGMISELPTAEREQVTELVSHIRAAMDQAGTVVGTLAIALIGAEEQAKP